MDADWSKEDITERRKRRRPQRRKRGRGSPTHSAWLLAEIPVSVHASENTRRSSKASHVDLSTSDFECSRSRRQQQDRQIQDRRSDDGQEQDRQKDERETGGQARDRQTQDSVSVWLERVELNSSPDHETMEESPLPETIPEQCAAYIKPWTVYQEYRNAREAAFRNIKITQTQADKLEETTRDQALSDLWWEHRRGRLTGSFFGKIYLRHFRHVNADHIVHASPGNSKNDAGCQWGKAHEQDALLEYESVMRRLHRNFRRYPAGLVVNPSFPHLGATPDGFVECSCCGKGVVEVKCPMNHRHDNPCTVSQKRRRTYCLDYHVKSPETFICSKGLRHDHRAYFQVQGQMAVCKVEYCHFVCWTTAGIHIERVPFKEHVWTHMKSALDDYYHRNVLPKLLNEREVFQRHLIKTCSTKAVKRTTSSKAVK